MVRTLLTLSICSLLTLSFSTSSNAQKLQTLSVSQMPLMEGIDVSRLNGTWYPVAHMSNTEDTQESHLIFEQKGEGLTISKVKGDNTPEVMHTASMVDKNNAAVWKTTGKGLFKPKLYFLYVDTVRYNFCMVTNGDEDKLWILSRKKELDPVKYAQLVRKAQVLQFRVDELQKIYYEKAPQEASVLDSASH